MTDHVDENPVPPTASGVTVAFVTGGEMTLIEAPVDGTDATNKHYVDSVAQALDSVFIQNTGDILDSGTLTIASGATVAVATGAALTIADSPATGTDAANKDYVDSIAQGLDTKESVQVATLSALIMGVGASQWGYADNGGVSDTLTVNTAGTTTLDTISVAEGYRVLVKDQVDAKQNGIYVATSTSNGTRTILTRALDHNGSPASDVSSGNFTFIELGTQASTGWVTMGTGILTLNTDDLDWTQFSNSSTFSPGIGLSLNGNEFGLHIDNLTADTITSADQLAFNDASEPNITNKTTVADFLSDLAIVNSVPGDGIIVRTAANNYTNRIIVVDDAGNLAGLSISEANGVSGNPTIGLDIQNLPSRAQLDPASDRVAVWDASADENVYYTVSDIAGSASATTSAIALASSATSMSVKNSTPEIIPGMTSTPVASGSYIVTYNSKFLVDDTSSVTAQAKQDALALYADLSTRVPTGNETVRTGGVVFSDETIGPGVYTQAGAVAINGTLTLDAGGDINAEFILGTTVGAFTTGIGAEVVLINGASSSNVWIISSAATATGGNTILKGSLLALIGAPSTGAGTHIEGRIITTDGAIALGAGTIMTTPIGVSQAKLGTLTQFSAYSGAGAVSTTGTLTTVSMSVGSDLGAITGFSGLGQVGGSIIPASATETSRICVGVYINGELIPDSMRCYNHLFNGIDHEYPIVLQTIATITPGQTIDVRTYAEIGSLTIGPRMSLMMLPMSLIPIPTD
jgi:hypothetical protein